MSSIKVRRRELGEDGKLIDKAITPHRTWWSERLLRMFNHRLNRAPMLVDVEIV